MSALTVSLTMSLAMRCLLTSLVALGFGLVAGQPGQCNQKDGDYPGCGLSKLTHSSSQPQAGKKWLQKYFPVQVPGDECTNDICNCPATSTYKEAWHIYQGRVYTTREISPGGGGPPPGNGFGLHLVEVPAHLTTGGLTNKEVEAHFTEKLRDMTSYDSFMDFNAVFATSGLQAYKNSFKSDGVKYLAGTWTGPTGTEYTSIIVQVPNSQLILELVQQGSLTYDEDETPAVKLEQRVPDELLIGQVERLTSNLPNVTKSGAYIVSLGINRAASAKSMAQLEDFYVTGMGTQKTHDSSENGVSKKCFRWKGATGNLCFTNRPDTATKGNWKVGDLEDMLNTVHKTLLDGNPFCQMDKWFDNHYAIDSQSLDSSSIVKYVNEKKPYHICVQDEYASASLATLFDPTGLGIQLDAQVGGPSDCEALAAVPPRNSSRRLQSGTYNPACDETDTTKCGTLSGITLV